MSRKIDPRVKRTKSMFESALLELMEKHDYKKITVLEIAKTSTLNRATFYLHYYDKDDLLEQLLDEALEDLKNSLQILDVEYEYKSDNPHPTFVRLFEKMQDRHRFYTIMLVRENNPYFADSVRKIIKKFVKDGSDYMIRDNIKYSVPVDISISYVSAAYLGVIVWWLKHNMPYSPTYMASILTRMSTVGPFDDNPYINN